MDKGTEKSHFRGLHIATEPQLIAAKRGSPTPAPPTKYFFDFSENQYGLLNQQETNPNPH